MRLFYYKMRQFYYKMRQLLQNATFITNCDSTSIIETTSGIVFPVNYFYFFSKKAHITYSSFILRQSYHAIFVARVTRKTMRSSERLQKL